MGSEMCIRDRGSLVKAGRSLVFGEVTLFAADDETRPLCKGSLTYAVIS